MPLFLVKTRDNSIEQVLRAACMSCARRIAVENAGAEGTLVWRDPALSTVQLIQDGGVYGVVLRKENDNAKDD